VEAFSVLPAAVVPEPLCPGSVPLFGVWPDALAEPLWAGWLPEPAVPL
jgi:hypothetical protein